MECGGDELVDFVELVQKVSGRVTVGQAFVTAAMMKQAVYYLVTVA